MRLGTRESGHRKGYGLGLLIFETFSATGARAVARVVHTVEVMTYPGWGVLHKTVGGATPHAALLLSLAQQHSRDAQSEKGRPSSCLSHDRTLIRFNMAFTTKAGGALAEGDFPSEQLTQG